jgi:hypothetical protein
MAISPRTDKTIRDDLESLLIRGGFSEDLASKVCQEMSIEQIKIIKPNCKNIIQKHLPTAKQMLLILLSKDNLGSKIGSDLFIELVHTTLKEKEMKKLAEDYPEYLENINERYCWKF